MTHAVAAPDQPLMVWDPSDGTYRCGVCGDLATGYRVDRAPVSLWDVPVGSVARGVIVQPCGHAG